MKIKHLLIAFSGLTMAFVPFSQLISNPTGAPAGSTGSPADGSTCFQSGCHFGSPEVKTDIITSDVPVSGYVPGTTYNITVSFTGSGPKGFQVSPQNASGQLLGTLTAGSGNKIVSSKYVTHTSAQNGATATWTFKWQAPAKGTGSVTFYGAGAATRNTTWKTTYTAPESATAGNDDLSGISWSVYPNPCTDHLALNALLPKEAPVKISVRDLQGKQVQVLFEGEGKAGANRFEAPLNSELVAGLYILVLEQNGKEFTRKLVKY